MFQCFAKVSPYRKLSFNSSHNISHSKFVLFVKRISQKGQKDCIPTMLTFKKKLRKTNKQIKIIISFSLTVSLRDDILYNSRKRVVQKSLSVWGCSADPLRCLLPLVVGDFLVAIIISYV